MAPPSAAPLEEYNDMDGYLVVAWLLSGMVAGFVIGLWVNPGKNRRRAERARAAAQDQQQRRQIDKLKLSQQELTAQLAASTQRHDRQIEMLKQSHAVELRAAEQELSAVREQLMRLSSVAEEGQVISGTSFVATRFDDNPAL